MPIHGLRFLILIAVLLLSAAVPHKVKASGEFVADYNVAYNVSPQGVTIVNQDIILTNKVANIFPKQYSIILDTDKIKSILASDDGGYVEPQVRQSNGQTRITLQFNNKNIGIGKKTKFSLRYEHTDIARKNGSVWEVNIPAIKETPDLGSYNVTIVTPQNFGPAAFIKPSPGNDNIWNKAQMLTGGINIAFGSLQSYRVNLHYFLKNTETTTAEMEISLPPDTAFQKVKIVSINPKPKFIDTDADGNWLARYNVEAGGEVSIDVTGQIDVFLDPNPDFHIRPVSVSDYLKPTKYWPAGNSHILAEAEKLKTPLEVYNFVVKTLNYKYPESGIKPVRLGALEALDNPAEAVCTEFTDLFIAVARAAKIPARAALGYAYTYNSQLRPVSLVNDILHAWPEYFDQDRNLWIPVDPTWTSTTGGVDYFEKMDFNHIVFTINGLSDSYPYPAGSYRLKGSTQKNVTVDFATSVSQGINPPGLTPQIVVPDLVISGIPVWGKLVLDNTSGIRIPNFLVLMQTEPKGMKMEHAVAQIAPFSKYEIPFNLYWFSWWDNIDGKIMVTVNGVRHVYPVRIYSITFTAVVICLGLLVLTAILWLITHLISKKRK